MLTAHYVVSTHWDREWYEPFQGYRMRLVNLLDELLEQFATDPAYKSFFMDGQVIPITDFLEIRPEKLETLRKLTSAGKFEAGPWYVAPDEWLVSGESLVRNIQLGQTLSKELLGAEASRAGFVCDQFGHTSQLVQIFKQLGLTMAFIWRGTHEADNAGLSLWRSPDGSELPAYRFAYTGYCSYAFKVRSSQELSERVDRATETQRLVDYTLYESVRTPNQPILLFDGGDHNEIDRDITYMIAHANEKLAAHNIRIVHSSMSAYIADVLTHAGKIRQHLAGELRETGRPIGGVDDNWLIPGILSSRIHLKQRNAACEDELCNWAEPFSAFAAHALGSEYPAGYLRTAWRHLLDNHPHDSMCGCSPDQVHQDMIFRFDQSIGISSRLTAKAHKSIALACAARDLPEHAISLTVFNPAPTDINEPLDLEIPLPTTWPKKYQEFFGFEEKFSFRIKDAVGNEIPYQLLAQRRDRAGFRRFRGKFVQADPRHVMSVTTAPLPVPACGYTTLRIEPIDGPTRYLGSMATTHNSIENEHMAVAVNPNGTLKLTDKRSGKIFDQLLTFEQRADIGDGWYHGLAVNDQIFTSSAAHADVALIADGRYKAALRITVAMNVPKDFDFKTMTRSNQTAPLKITSDITLRKGSDHVEVTTTVDNTIFDHRLRVLFPTNLSGDTYLSDAAFDVIERKIALAPDNETRRELDVETRPQQTWTAFSDGNAGLAITTRGLPESTVRETADRPIALTLLRAFRRAVLHNDNMGGQIQGAHVFRYAIHPFAGKPPIERLFSLGRRTLGVVRTADCLRDEIERAASAKTLPPTQSFLSVSAGVVTSIQQQDQALQVRLFNPTDTAIKTTLQSPIGSKPCRAITLDGQPDSTTKVSGLTATLPPKRIATLLLPLHSA